MTKWLALLCSAVALGAVAGCGGDDEEEPTGGGGAQATERTTDTAGRDSRSTRVVMRDIAFRPSELTVRRGTEVTWVNEDSAGHDVTKTGGPGPDFKSGSPGAMAQGATYEHVFDTRGTIEYVCTVHPQMRGTVRVE